MAVGVTTTVDADTDAATVDADTDVDSDADAASDAATGSTADAATVADSGSGSEAVSSDPTRQLRGWSPSSGAGFMYAGPRIRSPTTSARPVSLDTAPAFAW